MKQIEVIDLCYEYKNHNSNYEALKKINLTIEAGEFLCLVGPSGCGKTTFLRLLTGLEKASAGRILIDGKETNEPGVDRAIVFQHYALFPWMKVKENVSFAIRQAKKKLKRKEADAIAVKYLDKVHLKNVLDSYPCQLSGGMCQRVAIARAMAMDAEILLMDEPFGALDTKNRTELQNSFAELWDEESKEKKKTVVFVTHDIEEALLLGDRVVYMSEGKITGEVRVNVPRSQRRSEADAAQKMEMLRNDLLNYFYQEEL